MIIRADQQEQRFYPYNQGFSFIENQGFSFIELMISMTILCIALLISLGVIVSNKKTFKAENEVMAMTQNSRASLDILLRELRMAGYKVLEDQFLGSLPNWVSSEYLPSVPATIDLTQENSAIITEGSGSNPDMITILVADAKPNNLLSSCTTGNTTLTLDPDSAGYEATPKFRVNDLIRLGDHTEFAKVTAVSGQTLTIDTNPTTTGNQGFAIPHPAGEPIREVNIITYTVFNEANDPSYANHLPGHPVLKRKHNENIYVDLAEDVEDLQIIPHAPPRYKIRLVTRTNTKGNYVNNSEDEYKRTELLVNFRLRNFKKPECLAPATPSISSLTGLTSASPCLIHVSWSPVTEDLDGETLTTECAVSDYIVTYANTPETRFYTAYPGTTTSCDLNVSAILRDPNLQTYYISVVAVNCSGLSSYSDELTISDTSPPSAVTNLTAGAQGHSIILQWSATPECDVAEYHIYRNSSIEGGTFTILSPMMVTEPGVSHNYTFTDENLACATYTYRIKAYDYAYESAYSNTAQAAITDTDPPASPDDFSSSILNDTITFYWDLSSDDPLENPEGDADVTSYHLYGFLGETAVLLTGSIPAGQTSITLTTQGYANLLNYTQFGLKAVDLCDNSSGLVTQAANCLDGLSISITSPFSGYIVGGSVDIAGNAYSPNGLLRIELSIDRGPWVTLDGLASWDYCWDTLCLVNGDHTIIVRAKDNQDCFKAASITVTVQN